jgi:hypothetical protein
MNVLQKGNEKFNQGKGKAVPLHAMEALGEERRYSSYSFSTSALDGGEWSASRPGRAFTPVPIVQEAGWAPDVRGKILCPVVRPVVRHYTA